MNTTETMEENTNNLPAQVDTVAPGFGSKDAWELAQRQALALTKSTLVPKSYQGNVGDCLIALDIAYRIGASPLLVMQNLYVVQGRPGWSSTFLIASINHCGRYTALRYEERGEDPTADDYAVRAWAEEKRTGQRLNGTWITWTMVKAEGWLNKPGSKWKTMPDQMFKYRAAAFWQRAYAPEISMGLLTKEEAEDIGHVDVQVPEKVLRLTPVQMKSALEEVRSGNATIEEIEEQAPNLAAEQMEQLREAAKGFTLNTTAE